MPRHLYIATELIRRYAPKLVSKGLQADYHLLKMSGYTHKGARYAQGVLYAGTATAGLFRNDNGIEPDAVPPEKKQHVTSSYKSHKARRRHKCYNRKR